MTNHGPMHSAAGLNACKGTKVGHKVLFLQSSHLFHLECNRWGVGCCDCGCYLSTYTECFLSRPTLHTHTHTRIHTHTHTQASVFVIRDTSVSVCMPSGRTGCRCKHASVQYLCVYCLCTACTYRYQYEHGVCVSVHYTCAPLRMTVDHLYGVL